MRLLLLPLLLLLVPACADEAFLDGGCCFEGEGEEGFFGVIETKELQFHVEPNEVQTYEVPVEVDGDVFFTEVLLELRSGDAVAAAIGADVDTATNPGGFFFLQSQGEAVAQGLDGAGSVFFSVMSPSTDTAIDTGFRLHLNIESFGEESTASMGRLEPVVQ